MSTIQPKLLIKCWARVNKDMDSMDSMVSREKGIRIVRTKLYVACHQYPHS
jgi:hypothetical protein